MMVCRAWSKTESRDTFCGIFQALFDAVKSVTGRELKLKVLHPKTGTLHGFIADGDVAQAQGLGDVLAKLPRGEGCEITTNDPLEMIRYVLRTCMFQYAKYYISLPAL